MAKKGFFELPLSSTYFKAVIYTNDKLYQITNRMSIFTLYDVNYIFGPAKT